MVFQAVTRLILLLSLVLAPLMAQANPDPRTGRYLQADPNATGLVLLSAAHSGQGIPAPMPDQLDLDGSYGNGPNLYEYLGSSPWMHSDPLGLYFDEFDWFVDQPGMEHIASTTAWMEEISTGFKSALHVGLQIAQLHPGLNIVISAAKLASGEYTVEQVLIDMAVGYVGGKAIVHGIGAFNKMKAIYKSRRALRGVSEMYEHVYKMGRYDDMADMVQGFNHGIERHHILESKHLRRWGLNTGNAPAVILTHEEHVAITRVFEQRWRALGPRPTQAQVWSVYEEVYSGHPEWLAAIRHYFP